MEGPGADDVAIVVPLHTLALTQDERISFRHLRHYLGDRDTFLVLPEGLQGTIDGLPVRRFEARFFASHRAHQALMLDPQLYESFAAYTFVLVYHLDPSWLPGMIGEARLDVDKRPWMWIWTHRLIDFLRLKLWM